jgi:hypothetical protein
MSDILNFVETKCTRKYFYVRRIKLESKLMIYAGHLQYLYHKQVLVAWLVGDHLLQRDFWALWDNI